MSKRVSIYVHGSKESSYEAAEKAGFTGEALKACAYLGYEHQLEYEVADNGDATLLTIDGRELLPEGVKAGEGPVFSGMSIRDHFAGQAMQGLLSNPSAMNELLAAVEEKSLEGVPRREAIHSVVAKRAYWQAEAMLARRGDLQEKKAEAKS